MHLKAKPNSALRNMASAPASLSLTGPINDQMAYPRVGHIIMTEDGIVTDIRTGKSVNNVESYGIRAPNC